jgi:hypothetical protein
MLVLPVIGTMTPGDFIVNLLPSTPYQEDEYTLLGMAIKYAGLRGEEVRVIGKNRSSLGEDDRIH